MDDGWPDPDEQVVLDASETLKMLRALAEACGVEPPTDDAAFLALRVDRDTAYSIYMAAADGFFDIDEVELEEGQEEEFPGPPTIAEIRDVLLHFMGVDPADG